MAHRRSVFDTVPFSWYNLCGSMGEPSLGSGPLCGGWCPEELPDSLSCFPGAYGTELGAGQGRPTKP